MNDTSDASDRSDEPAVARSRTGRNVPGATADGVALAALVHVTLYKVM
jgi:hypothetical protein